VSPVIETKDFSVTLFDFLRGWEKVRQPHGEIMSSIVANIDAMPLTYRHSCSSRWRASASQRTAACRLKP